MKVNEKYLIEKNNNLASKQLKMNKVKINNKVIRESQILRFTSVELLTQLMEYSIPQLTTF